MLSEDGYFYQLGRNPTTMYCKNIQFFLSRKARELLKPGKSKVFYVREKKSITGFHVLILCFENVKSPEGVGHMGGPPGQAVKTVVDAFRELVTI